MPFDLATAKPVDAGRAGGFDLQSAKPVTVEPPTEGDVIAASVPVPRRATEAELNPPKPSAGEIMKSAVSNIPSATDVLKAPIEVGASLATGMVTPMLHDAGFKKTAEALQYQPKSPVAKSALESLGKFMDVSKLAGMTPSANPARAPAAAKLPKSITKMEPQIAARPHVGAGAEQAVNELQRQGEVMQAGKVGPTTGAESAVEGAMAKSQGATGQFREILERDTGNYDPAAALSQIDQLMKAEGSTPVRRAALQEVKKEIEAKLSAAKESTASVAPSGRMTAAEYQKFLKGGDSPKGLGLNAVDSIRQTINDIISRKDSGGNRLNKDAEKALYDVRNALLAKTPEGYQKAIAGMAETREAVDQLTPRPYQAMDAKRFESMTAHDKQVAMESIFSEKMPSVPMAELVRDLKHDATALQGAKNAYTEWLSSVDKSGLPKPNTVADRWHKTRDAVVDAGLIDKAHAANIDKTIRDLEELSAGKVSSSLAAVAGFAGGTILGAPLKYARLARDVNRKFQMRENVGQLEKVYAAIMAEPEGAALLAAKPTPENLKKLSVMLPPDMAQTLAPMIARSAQPRDDERKNRPNPLSMRPAGL